VSTPPAFQRALQPYWGANRCIALGAAANCPAAEHPPYSEVVGSAFQLIGDPAVDGQVVWGRDGEVARNDGTARFSARIQAGPLLDGWLDVQGLDDPVGAEIHLVLNDHGPVIDGMRREMLSTYRAGCADSSPFPPLFPAKALADGTPGPNTCLLYQSAVFPAIN
jgi:hypothetical protein